MHKANIMERSTVNISKMHIPSFLQHECNGK